MSDLQCPATFLVARHAEAAYESTCWSDAGGSLTPLGRQQARDLGAALLGRRVAHVYCSPRSRAVQTAEIAAAVLRCGVTVREGLQELAVGEATGTPYDVDPFIDVFARWLDGDLHRAMAGAESGQDVADRVGAVLQSLADLHRGETVLVVTHAGAMRIGLTALVSRWRTRRDLQHVPNCAYAELSADSNGWVGLHWVGASR